jgi:hypothetical protein
MIPDSINGSEGKTVRRTYRANEPEKLHSSPFDSGEKHVRTTTQKSSGLVVGWWLEAVAGHTHTRSLPLSLCAESLTSLSHVCSAD